MSVHFRSSKHDWETPQNFYNVLDTEFNFTLDPCALPHNAKCSRYYTPKHNGLKQDWTGERVFMNPPYGRQITHWVAKAYVSGLQPQTLVVALIPSRTDTRYWHNYVMKAREIRFVKGRLRFSNSHENAPFPSAVVIFTDGRDQPRITTMIRPEDQS